MNVGGRAPRFLFGAVATGLALAAMGQPAFQLPTANQALFEPGGEERFFVGTVGRGWESGTFGCVRSEGRQFHEGLDIRPLHRDKRGEATDPVLASADGTVAYLNRKAGLSNYGIYVVLRHQVEGLEVFTLYAHLREARADLVPGAPVRAGDPIGILGRTANTREGIGKDRAHVHFEINFFLNDRFAEWHQRNLPGQRNDHGNWNGRNLLGLDPRALLLAQRELGDRFRLVTFVQQQPELCRVQVRATDFPWLRRYAPLLLRNPRAEREGVAGYELGLNCVGIPVRVIPRAEGELRSRAPVQLVGVNRAEADRQPCQSLVARDGDRWRLTRAGEQMISLLTY
jgi:murein DD-endopeptidase MepM/ murein hydrolase activator NlpD